MSLQVPSGRIAVQSAALVIASLGMSYGLWRIGAPAAILVGPMLVGIGFGVAGSPIRVPRPLFIAAQGVVGCLIAGGVSWEVLRDVAAEWPWMLFGVMATIAASTLVGWVMTRFGALPGTTAAWGSSPGAASAMVAMADDYGADARLVALMQYVRVIVVVLAAALVTRLFHHPPGGEAAAGGAVPSLPTGFDPYGLAATLVIAIGGAWLGRRLRVPAGGLLVPLAIAAALSVTGLVRLSLPVWLLVCAYGAIGWYIGLQFQRQTVLHAMRLMPQICAAALVVVLLAGLAAVVMSALGPHDLLTTFLATSPGGIDSVAILAFDGGADTPFVLAMQTLRVLVVVATGPMIARALARTAPQPSGLVDPEVGLSGEPRRR